MNTWMIAIALAAAQDVDDRFPLPPVDAAPAPRQRMSNVGYGPLRVSSQSPFRAGPAMEAPSSLAAGGWELRDSTTWSRMWGQTDDYLLSFETLRRSLSAVHGLSGRLHAELGVASSSRFGGSLDGVVKNFHDAAGLSQGGRDSVPEGEYVFRVGGVDVPEVRMEDGGEQVFAALHYTLSEGSAIFPAISTSVSAAYGDSIDASASISLAKRWGDLHGYLSVAGAWYGHDEFYGLDLQPFVASILTAVEWAFLPDLSLVLQHLWSSGDVKGYGDLSKPSYEVSLGLKVEAAPGSVFEIGLTENILVFDNSPDVGMHAGLTLIF